MELAGSSLIAGASRLVYGVVQLMLVVFGVGLGLHASMHFAEHSIFHPAAQMSGWSFGVAIVVIGVGLYLYLSAPHGSLLWLIAAVGVALAGQRVGEPVAAALNTADVAQGHCRHRPTAR